MRRAFRRMWVVTGLALLATMIVGEREARAALTGLTITGGVKPGTGDPTIDYVFSVYLNSGSSFNEPYTSLSSLLHPDSFTIDGLVGVTHFSWTSQPLNGPQPRRRSGSLRSNRRAARRPSRRTSPGRSMASRRSPTLHLHRINTAWHIHRPDQELSGGPIAHPSHNPRLHVHPRQRRYRKRRRRDLPAHRPHSRARLSTIVLLIGGSAALGGLIVRRRQRRLAHGLTPDSPTSMP